MKALDLWLVVAMVPFATANPILYAYIYNWRRSPEGRAVMTLSIGLALLVDLAVLYALLPWFPGKPAVAAVVYALILLGLARFTVVLVRGLREQCRRKRAKARHD